jgi:S-formylglutathione hydrolase
VRPRNRWFYPAEVPQALLGTERDAALYARDQPVARARAHADGLRACELPIYIDAAGNDLFSAHDGAEYLHRWLWQLDIAHEYHLRRDSEHSGPDMLARIETALVWVAEHLQPSAARPRDPLREQLETPRHAAAALDPNLARRYGLL